MYKKRHYFLRKRFLPCKEDVLYLCCSIDLFNDVRGVVHVWLYTVSYILVRPQFFVYVFLGRTLGRVTCIFLITVAVTFAIHSPPIVSA